MNAFLYVNSLLHQEVPKEKIIGREKFQKQIVRGSYPFPLMPKGGEKIEACRQGEQWS
jgi:hypothetical protein